MYDVLRELDLEDTYVLHSLGLPKHQRQNIYNPEYKDGIDILESYPCTKFKLFVNCRNTIQIGTYSSKASGIEFTEFLQENGEEVQKVVYTDTADFKIQIKEIMKKLRNEKVDLQLTSWAINSCQIAVFPDLQRYKVFRGWTQRL